MKELYFDINQMDYIDDVKEEQRIKHSSMDRLLNMTDNLDLDFLQLTTVSHQPTYDIAHITDIPDSVYDDFKYWFKIRAEQLKLKTLEISARCELKRKIDEYKESKWI